MDKNIVDEYTWNVLKKQLQKFKVTNKALYSIIEDVKKQLNSFIANYKNEEFRKVLLLIGSEEGTFYEPKNEQIANMVVITIRNSLLEGICSSSYLEYGADGYLNDNQIKDITSKAIEFFSTKDLEKESLKINLTSDFYKDISQKYPVAIKALIELSKCTSQKREHSYKCIDFDKPYELEELDSISSNELKRTNIESGITPKFNDSLCNFLKGIKEGKSHFFVTDCFKMTTRNFEKLLRIIEFTLTHDAIFITSNYFIKNDYVSRRENILRASHNSEQFFDKIKSISDISQKYKYLLDDIEKSF